MLSWGSLKSGLGDDLLGGHSDIPGSGVVVWGCFIYLSYFSSLIFLNIIYTPPPKHLSC